MFILSYPFFTSFSGLANPAPIIQTFYAEDKIFNDVKLDGVVTLVDAKHAGFHLDEIKPKGVVNEAVEQIAYADRIIVNKVMFIFCLKLIIIAGGHSDEIVAVKHPPHDFELPFVGMSGQSFITGFAFGDSMNMLLLDSVKPFVLY